ncbi:MAG TPA: pentapeptide repeat-containing protein [Jatrophihabitantaceae bacterium]|nr:pentapeptide repeat-containing protein [Jatrophihabitantaceae bacterium]
MSAVAFRADCASCFGLCCVVPAFSKSAEFAINKPALVACPNLGADSRCGIHDRLRPRGFSGCTVYDCFGAGQQVSQVTFGGTDWRTSAVLAEQMFAVFPVMRVVQEVLSYLVEACGWPSSAALRAELSTARDELSALTRADAAALLAADVDSLRGSANALLLQASEARRADQPATSVDHRGATLIGASLCGRDLRGASLRGAQLVGADLRDADLQRADLIGADLRGADLSGADLRDALFLTQSQLDAARGDGMTRLDDRFTPPPHWV